MALYYRGPDVRITHKVFETHQRHYLLDELTYPEVVQRRAGPTTAAGSARVGSASAAGAIAIAFAFSQAEGWDSLDSPLTRLVLILLLLISVVAAGACWRIEAMEYELTAVYRGEPVSLHRTADTREFGQVRRALVRALQQREDAR